MEPSALRQRAITAACVLALLACGADGDSNTVDVASSDTGSDSAAVPDAPLAADASDVNDAITGDVIVPFLPWDASPCEHPDAWPHAISSAARPLTVHYQRPADAAMAADVLAGLEAAWTLSVDTLGFRAPTPDAGACGLDDRYDAFLWQGQESAYVDCLAEVPATPHDDSLTYLIIDPWSDYGGPLLDITLAHELNHACQATDDWFEAGAIYEMTATFVEALAEPDDLSWANLVLEDFQTRPDWTLDRYDDYETWYMYGASLYFHYLRARYNLDAAFIGAISSGTRNPPATEVDPSLSEPDWVDAIDAQLQTQLGGSFLDSIPGFARWRWFVSTRDDGRHFPFGALLDTSAAIPLTAEVALAASTGVTVDPGVMVLGSAYIRVTGTPGTPLNVQASPVLAGPVAATPRTLVQALPEATEPVPTAAPTTTVTTTIGATGSRVLVVTHLPASEVAYDPDETDDDRVVIDVTWSTAPIR